MNWISIAGLSTLIGKCVGSGDPDTLPSRDPQSSTTERTTSTMPLLLNDLDLSTVNTTTTIDPKFFSSKLTGSGKKVGLLNVDLKPTCVTANPSYQVNALSPIEIKTRSVNNSITISTIPMAPIVAHALTDAPHSNFTIAMPVDSERHKIETSSNQWDVFFTLTPQGAKLYEDMTTGAAKQAREFVVQYRMEMFFVLKSLTELPERVVWAEPMSAVHDSFCLLDWVVDPIKEAAAFVDKALKAKGCVRTDPDALGIWMHDAYNIYDSITAQAEIWASEKIADEVCAYIDGMPVNPESNGGYAWLGNPASESSALNALALQMRYLENYNIPLEAYRIIHAKMAATFTEQLSAVLSKQNLNLLMSHTLFHLDSIKSQLCVPAQPTTPGLVASLSPQLSPQQIAAVTTHEPLVLTQAGAGTGKSTVILERIKYLEACGVDAADVTVLSFTNAAADNITDKNPRVGSMTTARMIHDIYRVNYPNHEISSIDTIVNSIDIFYPTSDFAAKLRARLIAVDENKTGAFTGLNTFIENHLDEVISLLDRIKQTSLELEIILCYQQINTMIEPAHVLSKYLIIDEVQDNSIFEFIYVLKYVSKYQQSLFIVGDASQTLYEFRSANPRALNTLEGSGVFSTFKLTTNYRSNQEILDFANIVLGDLETNQFANIQLQANSLAVPTADTFQEKVTLDFRPVARLQSFVSDTLPGIVQNTIIPDYVEPCLNRGEQVAFLAYSRREVMAVETVLHAAYPQRTLANLTSEKVYATDIFSKYIKMFWNDVLQVQPTQASFVVHQGIKDNLEKLSRQATNKNVAQAVLRMISNWWLENAATIRAWEQLTLQGALSHADFFERLRDNLLSFEIRHNAVRLQMTNQKNRDRKVKNAQSKADLVVSTIHGAKGLEFDNVVVLHKEDARMGQESKRLYYVAFTRAMLSEYILSYGSTNNPPIVSRYAQILDTLRKNDARNAARAAAVAAGLDPDAIDLDDYADAQGTGKDALAKVS